MQATQIRKQLHDFVDSTEDKKLEAIYDLFEDGLVEDYRLTKTQIAELDKKYVDHQNGIGRTYTWEETVNITEPAYIKHKR